MTVIRGNVLEIKGFLEKRHLEFHEKIKEMCVNRQRFKGGFKVNYSHIDKKSGVEFVRANLGDEQLASVIRGGQLNFEECQAKGSNCCEVAIEACMLNLQCVDFSKSEDKAITLPKVWLRVVVREKRKLHVVVTAYELHEDKINLQVPEVESEIW